VLTHRPEFQPRWSGQGHVGALNLSKLTRAQSSAMISALAGGRTLPGLLLEQILTRTDGVPLFVEELTKSILESGELKQAGDHYAYAGLARAVTIPTTLRDSLMARLDRFMPVKEIAQIGAAIGREFSYELIAAIAPMPQAQLNDSLARLTESGLAWCALRTASSTSSMCWSSPPRPSEMTATKGSSSTEANSPPRRLAPLFRRRDLIRYYCVV
jgi:predicted ATPase